LKCTDKCELVDVTSITEVAFLLTGSIKKTDRFIVPQNQEAAIWQPKLASRSLWWGAADRGEDRQAAGRFCGSRNQISGIDSSARREQVRRWSCCW